MNIITELSNKITTHMSTCMEEALEEGTGLTGMIESTLELVREMGRDMIGEMISTAEESVLKSDERKAAWVVQSRNREKTVSTLLGDIFYSLKKEIDEKDEQIKILHDLLNQSLKNQSQSNFVLAQQNQQAIIESENVDKTLPWYRRGLKKWL